MALSALDLLISWLTAAAAATSIWGMPHARTGVRGGNEEGRWGAWEYVFMTPPVYQEAGVAANSKAVEEKHGYRWQRERRCSFITRALL